MATSPELKAARLAFSAKVYKATQHLPIAQAATCIAHAWGVHVKKWPSQWDASIVKTVGDSLAKYVAEDNREAVMITNCAGGTLAEVTGATGKAKQASFLNAVKAKAAELAPPEEEEAVGPNWMLIAGGAVVAYFLFMKKK
jgi:hypothetical protein